MKELAHYAHQLPELESAIEALKALAVTAVEITDDAITATGGTIMKRVTSSNKQLEQGRETSSGTPSETGSGGGNLSLPEVPSWIEELLA